MRVAIAAAGFAFLCVSTCPADARPGEPFVASITALPAVTGSVNLTVAGGGEGDGGRIARLAAREAQQAIRAANRDARDAARDAMQAARGAARESMQAARDAARMASMQAVQQSVTQAANFSALHQVQEAARNAGMDAARDVMNKASLQAGVRHIKIDRHQDFKHDNLELSGAVNNAAHESVQNVMRESHDVNFNLGAAKDGMYANIAAPVQISTGGKLDSNGFVVGGVAQTINPGDRISAAEYAAVQQVLGGGGQSVLLGEKGSAVGGAVTLTPDSGLNISRLQLPSSVQLNLVGFTETNPFTISGGARISGDVFSLQGEQGLGSFNNLGSLHIGESGNWTGTLPSFTGPGSLYSSSSLTFNIQNSLNNLGSITSPGALSINAGGNIVNTGSNALMQGASLALNAGQSISNTGALIATAGNASLYSSIGQITNAGLINAQNGNIAFDAASNSALYVNNTGGVIQALKGAVDMRLADYKGSAYSLLQGGDVLSETVNLYSGSGMTDMFVNEVTGMVNAHGTATHVSAATDTLTIGEQCLTGDPTYYNIGNISINGNITVGEKLAILATGNITSTAAATSIRAVTGAGVGQDITIIAGAALTPTSAGAGTATVSGAPPPSAVPGGGTVRVTGASAGGGNINFTAANMTIDASGTSGAGGNVTLLAFGDNTGTIGDTNGQLLLTTASTVNTSGSSGNANGNILAGAGRIAGGPVNAIQLGSLTANGGATTTGGTITVRVNQPTVVAGAGGGVLFDSTGSISNGGSFTVNTPTAVNNGARQNTLIIGAGAGQSISARDNVIIEANGTLTMNVGSISTNGGNYTSQSLTTANNLNLNSGSLATLGGNVLMTAGDNFVVTGTGTVNTTPAAGNGGSITINTDFDNGGAGDMQAIGLNLVTSAAGIGNAGSVDLISNLGGSTIGTKSITIGNVTSLGAGGGNGGDVHMNANDGNISVGVLSNSLGGCYILRSGTRPAAPMTARTITFRGDLNLGGAPMTAVSTSTITASAGVNIQTGGGNLNLVGGVNSTMGATSVTVTGRSGFSGTINLSGISSFNTGAGAVGGDVVLASLAVASGSGVGGQVLLPAALTATTNGGDFTVVAEQTNAAASSIVLGNLTTTGTGGSGNISINTATPTFPVTIDCDTGALTGSFVGGALQNGALTIGVINAPSGSTTNINVSRLDPAICIQGNVGILNVTLAQGLLQVGPLTSSGATLLQTALGGDILTCGDILNTDGGITMRTAGTAANGGLITLNHTVTQTGAGDLSLITSGLGAASNIIVNAVVSESGAGNLLVQTSGANSQLLVNSNVSADAGSTLTMTSGNSGTASVNLAAGVTVSSGSNVQINTPILNINTGSTLTSSDANVALQSNAAARALSVAFLGNGNITASNGNVTFNNTTAGQITVTGGATNGVISANAAAGDVIFNGGTGLNAVSVNVNQINDFCTQALGTTVSVTTANGDLRIEGTSSGAFTATANGAGADVITCGEITTTTAAGTVTLRTNGGADADVLVNNNVTAGGVLNLTSGTGAGSDVTVAAAVTVRGTTTNVTTPDLNIDTGSNVIATTGSVNVQSNLSAQVLTVDFLGNGNITANNGSVLFNNTTAGAITVSGGAANGTITANAAAGIVRFNGGNNVNPVAVDVYQISDFRTEGSGTTLSITTANGDLRVGNINTSSTTTLTANGTGADVITSGTITSTNGPVTLSANGGADSDVLVNNNVTSGGILNLTSGTGAGSDVTVAAAVTARGTTTNVTTPDLNINVGSNVTATTGSVNIQSNLIGTTALRVDFLGNGNITANSGNVLFNDTTAGAVTVTGGAANGVITANAAAGIVRFNGGNSVNPVDVNVRQISDFCTEGSATMLSITTGTGNLRVGNINTSSTTTLTANGAGADVITCATITSTNGPVTLRTNGGANADVILNNNVTSGGLLSLASGNGAGADVTLAAGVTAQGTAMNVTTPDLNINAGSNVIATTGNLSVQSNAASNALTVDFLGNGNITASNGNVTFNNTAAGRITVTGGPGNGAITANAAAGDVIFNGGTGLNAVSVNVNQINDFCTQALGTTVAITTANGDLRIEGASSGSFSAIANGAGADVITCGTITSTSGPVTLRTNGGADADLLINDNVTSGGALNLLSGNGAGAAVIIASSVTAQGTATTVTTPALEINLNSNLIATTGNLLVQSNAAANVLTVDFLGNGNITASNGNVSFNRTGAATQGQVTVTGGPANGVISANAGNGTVKFFSGSATPLNVNVNQINGCIGGSGNPFNVTTANPSVTGTLDIGDITSTGSITFNTNSSIRICDDLTAGVNINLTSGNGAGNFITQSVGAPLRAAQNINLTTGTLNANAAFTATAGDINIQSQVSGNELIVNMNAGSSLNATASGGDVLFNNTTAGRITVSGGPANGLINANTTNGIVRFNGGSGANDVAVDVRQINGFRTEGSGDEFSITTATGNLRVGNINTSSTTALIANGAGADVITAGTVTSTNGPVTIQANGGANSDILLNNNVTSGAVLNLTSGTGAGADITLAAGVTAQGTAMNVTTPDLNINTGSNVIATTGSVNIQSNLIGTTALRVDFLGNGNITANSGDVLFNDTTAGAVTVTGGAANGVITANAAAGIVSFNGGNGANAVSVNVNRINDFCTEGSGSTLAITTRNGDLRVGNINTSSTTTLTANGTAADVITCGAITSTNGPVTLRSNGGANANIIIDNTVSSAGALSLIAGTGAGSDVMVNADVLSGGALTITSGRGAGSDVTIAAAITAEGTTATVNSGDLNLNAGSNLTATTGNLLVQSSAAGRVLTVDFLGNGNITATAGNVSFNQAATPGRVTVTGGPANGIITANGGDGTVKFFSGSATPLNVNVNQINGCIGGSGNPFNVTTANPSVTGTLDIGDITSAGSITFNTNGSIRICDDLTAGININLTSGTGAGNFITQTLGAQVTANVNVNYNTPILNLNDMTTATTGNINIQGTTSGSNALTVNFLQAGNASALVATNGSGNNNINFNATTAGQITITGGGAGNPNGLINAGVNNNVTYNGNGATNNDVTVNVNQITGCNAGDGNIVSINTTAGDLHVGPFVTTSTATFDADGVGANVETCGNITAAGTLTLDAGTGDADVIINNTHQIQGSAVDLISGSAAGSQVLIGNGNASVTATTGAVSITTPDLDMSAGSNSITATAGNVVVDSNAPGNVLSVTIGGASLIATNAGDVIFNNPGAGNEGPVSITGPGTVQGNFIDYNVGPNALVVDVDQLIGCNRLNSSTGALSSIAMTTQVGVIDLCTDLNASNPTGSGGPISVTANGGAIDLGGFNVISTGTGSGNSGGTITIFASGGITNGGDIISNGLSGASGGSITLTAPGQDIVVQTLQALGNGPGNGGIVTTSSANLRVLDCDANAMSIDVAGGATGNGGTASITTTSTNRFVVGNPAVNGTQCGILADGGINGGLIMLTANGIDVNSGQSVTSNGATGNGGVVTFNPNNPGAPSTYNINGMVCAEGLIPDTGVVAFSAGAAQNMTLTVGATGEICAGQQITLGNADPTTGIQQAPPSGLITVSPLRPNGRFPNPPFDTPLVVVNGTLVVPPNPPGPPAPPVAPPGGGAIGFPFLSLPTGTTETQFIETKIPTDQTKIQNGYVSEDELAEDATLARLVRKGKGSRIIHGSTTLATSFELGDQEVQRLNREGVIVAHQTKEKFFNLDRGNVVFIPDRDIVVGTHEGRVFIPAGCVAFVMEDGADVAIFDLHQNGPNGIRVVSGDKLIKMDPGRMVVLSRERDSTFDNLLHDCRLVGYRRPKAEKLDGTITAYGVDFSIPSAMSNVLPLRKLLNSKQPAEKRAVDRILMNAVLLEEKTAGRGPYRTAE